MPSAFRLQVVYVPTGEVIEWAPGQQVERDLINELCDRVVAKGVGIGRTAAHVRQDVANALAELFHDLKADVPPSR